MRQLTPAYAAHFFLPEKAFSFWMPQNVSIYRRRAILQLIEFDVSSLDHLLPFLRVRLDEGCEFRRRRRDRCEQVRLQKPLLEFSILENLDDGRIQFFHDILGHSGGPDQAEP